MPDSTTDDSDLKTRVDRLEEVCREQQETIQKLMPSRRSVLAGAAGLGIGAASMSATSGSAAAQSAAGQVGTDSDRVDVFGATVDSVDIQTEALETEELNTEKSATLAYLSDSAQIVEASTRSKVQLDNTKPDQLNAFDTDNHKYVVPEDGTYSVSSQLRLDGSTDSEYFLLIEVNASEELVSYGKMERDIWTHSTPMTTFKLNEGDEIELYVDNKDADNSIEIENQKRFSYLNVRRE